MAGYRFEPDRSGNYKVYYRKENGFYDSEIIEYDFKKNEWKGPLGNTFYKENITSWETPDHSPIGYGPDSSGRRSRKTDEKKSEKKAVVSEKEITKQKRTSKKIEVSEVNTQAPTVKKRGRPRKNTN